MTEAPADPVDLATRFEVERPRLAGLAARVLGDPGEAEDVVQQAWLRLDRATRAEAAEPIENLAAWLTTVTTRLCLDRLRARVPVPDEDLEPDPVDGLPADPAEEVALADSVGVALQVLLDRLSPRERVAFVLHDTFGFEFTTIGAILEATPAAARKLASRAREKIRPAGEVAESGAADHEVVDAFMAAARGGDLQRLLALLAPDAEVSADPAAIALGTPARIIGRREVADFFDGSAQATLPVELDGRPGAAWYHRGAAMVLFDFAVEDGQVRAIRFHADPDVLAAMVRR